MTENLRQAKSTQITKVVGGKYILKVNPPSYLSVRYRLRWCSAYGGKCRRGLLRDKQLKRSLAALFWNIEDGHYKTMTLQRFLPPCSVCTSWVFCECKILKGKPTERVLLMICEAAVISCILSDHCRKEQACFLNIPTMHYANILCLHAYFYTGYAPTSLWQFLIS